MPSRKLSLNAKRLVLYVSIITASLSLFGQDKVGQSVTFIGGVKGV